MKKIVNHKNKPTLKKSSMSTKKSKDLIHKGSYSRNHIAIGPFIAATCIAVFIGLFLGFMMLNMFAKKENLLTGGNQQSLATTSDTVDNEQSQNIEPTTLNEMRAFVIQLGVFSEQENADSWAKTYEQAGIHSTVFQRNHQYFLFTGMAHSKEKAKEFAVDLSKQDIDVYVKEWITNQVEVELTEEESNWIQLFQEQWEATLTSLSKKEGMLQEDWKKILENHPENSDIITTLVEELMPIIEDEIDEKNAVFLQNKLLAIWKIYESTFISK